MIKTKSKVKEVNKVIDEKSKIKKRRKMFSIAICLFLALTMIIGFIQNILMFYRFGRMFG